MPTIKYHKILSLSHEITEDIPLWPGDPEVQFTPVAQMETDGYYLRRFSLGEHSGTHINAPRSFIRDAAGIESYNAASLVVEAVIIDVTARTRENSDYVISLADIEAWERKHGIIPQGSLIIFYTGWDELWGTPEQFLKEDFEGNLHFPGVSGTTTAFLLQERLIAGIAIDTHGVDPGLDIEYQSNKQLMAAQAISIECIANLQDLPATGITLVIGMLQLVEGAGSPVAITALIE